jgi:hypothetical protein
LAENLVGGFGVFLGENPAQVGGDDALSALMDVDEGVAHPMNPATEPGNAAKWRS